MATETSRGSFDRLVAGLSQQDRAQMLRQLNSDEMKTVQLIENEDTIPQKNLSLKLKYQNESIFLKILLWFRSIFEKKRPEKLYNETVLGRMERRITREHPGLINYHVKQLDDIFYQRLNDLKDAADFFKPFFVNIDANPGDFYVFLSSFVSPDVAEQINTQADPFILSFDVEPAQEEKGKLLKILDNLLTEMDGGTKATLYGAVSSVNWLKRFSVLPFIHFCSQFTNIVSSLYTCPYKNAALDFEPFASVFTNIQPVSNEVLEAIFLYKNRQDFGNSISSMEVERQIKEFISKANTKLAAIQMFITAIPVISIGKILNENFDWNPQPMEGAEAWFSKFRGQWRKILDIRWNEWKRERRKSFLANTLYTDFKLENFPRIKYHPWTDLWIKPVFYYELTAGFLSWFITDKYEDTIIYFNDILLEGVFNGSAVRNEYSDALNTFIQSYKQFNELLSRLSPVGEFGKVMGEYSKVPVKSVQIQNQIRDMMDDLDDQIHDIIIQFLKGAKVINQFLNKLFGIDKRTAKEVLQNFSSIKGRLNKDWKEKLESAHFLLSKAMYYICEMEEIDLSVKNA